MKLSFAHHSYEEICPNNKFGGYDVEVSTHLDDYGYEDNMVSFEVNDEHIPSLLATLAEEMNYWGVYKPFTNIEEFKVYINNLVKHYSLCIEDYYQCDDWDDYFILILIAQEYLNSGEIVESNLNFYNNYEE